MTRADELRSIAHKVTDQALPSSDQMGGTQARAKVQVAIADALIAELLPQSRPLARLALNQIANLGCCGGARTVQEGFQRAIDISVAGLSSAFSEPPVEDVDALASSIAIVVCGGRPNKCSGWKAQIFNAAHAAAIHTLILQREAEQALPFIVENNDGKIVAGFSTAFLSDIFVAEGGNCYRHRGDKK